MTHSDPRPLDNDATREAVDSMRGFSFQILRSIDAWLDLPSGEILMLEGAEDLDRIGPEGALVEQVKDTAGSGNITLRTAAVLAAIGNFWQHCQRNPDTLIRFRYLTTSDIGQERSDALADLDAAGIEAWQAIRHAPTSTEALSGAALIQSYLVGCESLPAALRTFLSSASVEDFVKSVVLPIEWVTGQARSPGLVRKIEARLVELGELLDIDAASAINALPKLHLEAWKNVSDNDRAPLRRGDLIRIVREAGTTHVTSALLMGLLKQVAGMPSGATPIVSPPPSVGRPPRPPRRHYSRPVLEENLRRALRLGATYLHGSTGMGKTYLARSVMIDLTKVGWLDLRDVRGQAIISKIQAATAFLASNADAMTIVLDDLDPGEDGRVLIPALQHLHEMLSARGGALLITGPQPLSPRLAHAIDITADRTFIAPAFALAEIAEFTAAAGCPDTDVENWSKIVSASTSGHPQLVDARLAALQQQGWPKPSLGEFVSQTAEIKDVRNEARRLVATLPEGERELLCRASLVIGRISRRRLLAVGAAEPGLFEPGHVIDRLTGPWLEVTDTSDLRVSPLLRGLASETRPQAWAREMNVNIAWAWLADPSLAAGDVSTLLMHAILGKRTGPLVQLLPSLLEASEDVWDEIGVTAGFLASLGVDEEHPNPFDAPLDKAVFRILQLRIAAQAQTQELPKIIDRAFKEFSEAAPEDLATGFFEFLFLWQLIRLDGMTHEVAALVDIGLRFRRAATRMSQNLNKLQQHNGAEHVKFPDLAPIFALTMLHSIADPDAFEQLLTIAEELDPNDQRFILPGGEGPLDAATMTLERLWLREFGKPGPDWSGFRRVLTRTIAVAQSAGLPGLADAAASVLVRVLDENEGDPASAVELAELYEEQIVRPVRLLAAKGKCLYRQQETDRSLDVYAAVVRDLDASILFRADIFRGAALAAARAQSWELCAERFRAGLISLMPEEAIARAVGFGFDYGLALFLADDLPGAVAAFSEAVEVATAGGERSLDETLLSARQYGYAAMVRIQLFMAAPSQGTDHLTSLVGRASSGEQFAWKHDRPIPSEFLVRQLLDLQMLAPNADQATILQVAKRLRSSRNVGLQGTHWETFTRLPVLTGDLDEVMPDCLREAAYFERLLALREAGEDHYQVLEADPPLPALSEAYAVFVRCRILAVIIAEMARGGPLVLPFEKWLAPLPIDQSYDDLRDFISCGRTWFLGSNDPWPEFGRGQPTWERRTLAALSTLARGRTAAELLAAHAMIAYDLNRPPLGAIVARPLSQLVTAAWNNICDTPAFLVAPRYSVPGLRAAIDSPQEGWPRIRGVLLAALPAINSHDALELRPYIEVISEG